MRYINRLFTYLLTYSLKLSTQIVRTLIGAKGMSRAFAYPEFIQLMDDDIVSLIGLALIANPSCREDVRCNSILQLYLSLCLMTKCQMKLHHPVTSLAQTLDYVEIARRDTDDFNRLTLEYFALDQLLLKLIERKIVLYIISRKLL